MSSSSYRRRKAVIGSVTAAATLAAAVTVSGVANASSSGARPDRPALKGHVSLYREAGDRIDFTFDARGLGPRIEGNDKPTTGTFTGRHFDKANKTGVWWDGHVDCLIVAGRSATFTVVVDHAHNTAGAPDMSATVGKRQGFTIQRSGGGKSDRFGYDWVFEDPGSRSVPQCMGPAPFEWIGSGHWTSTEWFPPNVTPPPGG